MSKRGMTAERAQRAQKVVQLHEDGATFDVIAKHLGISQTRARDDYNRAMKEAIPDVAQNVFRKVDRRLNKLHLVYWKRAREGDLKAARLCLDINKQLSDLWGLQGSVKLDVNVTSGQEFVDLMAAIRETKTGDDDGIEDGV
ncbi:hypothetical protein ACQX06_04035 [Corynebacterium diphtheriae]